MTIYLLVANILLINLLIASFNTIYNSVNARSLQFWNFQRFSVVLEYEEKPTLPAPFTVLTHFHRICKYVYRRCRGRNTRFESGLKLFLSKYDLERLYDFEEECVEGMLKENEVELQRKTDVRVKNVQDMMEEFRIKMDDLERWETLTNESSQSIDLRLQRLEDTAQQTASLLAVIHRFMATQSGVLHTPLRPGSPGAVLDGPGLHTISPEERSRIASCSSAKGTEQEQALLDLQHVHENNTVHLLKAKKPMLSREGTVDSEMLDFAFEGINVSSSKDTDEALKNKNEDVTKDVTDQYEEEPIQFEAKKIDPEEEEEELEDAKNLSRRRMSESSTGGVTMKKRVGSRAKKLIKSKKGGSVRLRHTSSGGSSTDLHLGKRSKFPGLSR